MKGFTLVELLVSIAIIALITTAATANFRAGRRGDELLTAGRLVAATLRRAQTDALAGRTTMFCRGGANDLRLCPSGLPASCPGGTCVRELPLGYGVRFTTLAAGAGKSVSFADLDGDRMLDPGEEIRTNAISPIPGVVVSVVAPSAAGVLDVVFAPPKPTTYFNGAAAAGIAAITVLHGQTGATRVVRVNGITGQVNAD